jgi:hypothetical protein
VNEENVEREQKNDTSKGEYEGRKCAREREAREAREAREEEEHVHRGKCEIEEESKPPG